MPPHVARARQAAKSMVYNIRTMELSSLRQLQKPAACSKLPCAACIVHCQFAYTRGHKKHTKGKRKRHKAPKKHHRDTTTIAMLPDQNPASSRVRVCELDVSLTIFFMSQRLRVHWLSPIAHRKSGMLPACVGDYVRAYFAICMRVVLLVLCTLLQFDSGPAKLR